MGILGNIMFSENPLSRRYDTNQIILQGKTAHAPFWSWIKNLGQASSNNFQPLKGSRKDGSERKLHIGNSEHRIIIVQLSGTTFCRDFNTTCDSLTRRRFSRCFNLASRSLTTSLPLLNGEERYGDAPSLLGQESENDHLHPSFEILFHSTRHLQRSNTFRSSLE
jgi:hypothetical protein